MQLIDHPHRRPSAAGFTLPAILVVVGALLILAVGALLMVGIERSTSRSFVDRQRADLAARAGLEDFKGILKRETANDDFLVVQRPGPVDKESKKEPIPYLYIARGSGGDKAVKFRYVPLFSADSLPPEDAVGTGLAVPDPETLAGEDPEEMKTLPWYDPASITWTPVKDANGKLVSRYAYWVEDLQGKIDAKVSGNTDGEKGSSARAVFPDPAMKPVKEGYSALSAMAIHVLDPKASDTPAAAEGGAKSLTEQIVGGRKAMISPDAILGATGILGDTTGDERDDETGILDNTVASVLERDVSTVNRSYLEQPIVPFSLGISKDVTGKPKLNLNKLLSATRNSAVEDFAAKIDSALPEFESKRKGGFPSLPDFPDNYLKTLAAGAMDYADTDSDPTVNAGVYVGMDSYPVLSELVLHIDFLGAGKVGSRHVLNWRFKLFGELWNMTNQTITNGSARLSYEVNLKPEAIGAGDEGLPFDDSSILSDPKKSAHILEKIAGKYYSPKKVVTLRPDEYMFYEFASVNYTIDYVPQFDKKGVLISQEFDLVEPENEARGITLRWNDQPVTSIQGIVRDTFGVSNFKTNELRKAAKAAIPGHSYGPHGFFENNMGDPRIAHYLRTTRLGENAYPDNISPGRRNIRRITIYDKDTSKEKRTHYGRVLPSEWPDGGHDSPTGAFTVTTNNSILPTDKTAWPLSSMPTPLAENAPQRISNLGRFYSATELGRVYDPILWSSAYNDLKGKPGTGKSDTEALTRVLGPVMPGTRNSWPEVTTGSVASSHFGGGNTLRIGRPEHSRFDKPGERAAQLLDLFHVGIPYSNDAAERGGEVIEIKGQINVNTAGKDALRAMAAGMLAQDPELRRVTSWEHDIAGGLFRPKTSQLKLGTPTLTSAADKIADAILLRRPFASPSEMAAIKDKDNNPVFGNKDLYTDQKDIQWSDAAAEEVFERVYESSTVRSRNFRVWVIGQSVTGSEVSPVVLSEARKVYTVFSDPGKRNGDGGIDPIKHIPKVTYENDF